MTFVPPKTFAVGEVLTAIDMNTFVRDNTADLDSRLNVISGANSFLFAGRRVITSSVTFEKDEALGGGLDTSWARLFLVTLVGGGGAGGGCEATGAGETACGGGGGAGGYVQLFIDASSLDAATTVTVGEGGAGASNATGGNGTSTVFGTFTAPGGSGGLAGGTDAVGSAGGSPATPLSPFGVIVVPGEGGSSAQLQIGGRGGNTPLGSGGRPGNPAQGGTGLAAQGFGSGGGGAGQGASQPARLGGAGRDGVVIIDVYR